MSLYQPMSAHWVLEWIEMRKLLGGSDLAGVEH